MDDSSSPDCLFCKIAACLIPTRFVYEDDTVVAFPDISPVSPLHYLVIPKQHFASIIEVPVEVMGRVHQAILQIVAKEGLSTTGFRLVNNCGSDGGQVVQHVHWHLLAGRKHTWPPG